MTPAGPLCALPHRHQPERPRLAIEGLLTCYGCAARIADTLNALPRLYDDLAAALPGPWRDHHPADRHALTLAEQDLPIRPAIADHRTLITRTLTSWAALTAEQRGETPPPADVAAACAWLTDRGEWLLAQDWIGDLSTELRDLRGAARNLLDPSGVRRIPCGPCTETIHGPALPDTPWPVPCPGTLIARTGTDPEDSADPTCTYCRHVVTIDHHAALRRGLAALVDAYAAATRLDVPVGTIARWASTGALTRRGKDARGRTLYAIADIAALVDARTGRIPA